MTGWFKSLATAACLGALMAAAWQPLRAQTAPPLQPAQINGCYLPASVISLATGQQSAFQCDSAGNLKVSGSFSAGGTTSNGTDGQATTSTNSPGVAYNYIFNGTTWDRLRGTGGAVNTLLTNAIPSGGNTIGAVNVLGGNATAVKVDGSAVTQPVSGTVTATTSGTASNASDGQATSTTNVPTVSYNYGWNGTTWDRVKVNSTTLPANALAVVEPDELAVSGSASSAATLFTQDMSGYSSITVQITANASSNTVAFETSDDNTNYISSTGLPSTSIGANSATPSNNSVNVMFQFPKRGRYFRVRVSNFISGTTTVVGNLHKNPAQVVIAAPTLQAGASIIGKVGIDQTTDVTTNGVEIAPTAGAAAGITSTVAGSAASSLVIKASAGNLYGTYATCTAACWLMVFNATSAPADGATTAGVASGNMQDCIPIAAGGVGFINYNPGPPEPFSVGITAVISSTACATKTAATTGFIHGSGK